MGNRQQAIIRLPLASGGHLDGYLSFQSEPGTDAVLYVHGFGSTRRGTKSEALEDACARRGWTFGAFDFRGHGQSAGSLLELSGSGLLEDLSVFTAHLASLGMRRIFPVGSSMGGWATAWFTLGSTPVAIPAVGLIAPAFRILQRRWETLSPEERQDWQRTGRLRVKNQWVDVEIGPGFAKEVERFPPESLEARWRTPLLIYHGLADETIPADESVSFVEGTSFRDIEIRLLKSGDHRLLTWKDELAEEFCRFFGKRWGCHESNL
jgi:pimeloyl-ACP methyl ester carboxylesterase